MRKAVLFPAIFAVVVVPLAVFVTSGAGTHMSPLLLYVPAAPWWLVYEGGSFVSEIGVLLIGCAINAFLLYLLGAAVDRRASAWVALKALALWLAILAFAMLNGALREGLLIPALGSFGAFIASGALLSACIFGVAWLATPWYGRLSSTKWLLVGLFWLLLTLAFEFGFGRLVQGKSWSELWEAYTFAGGNVWPLVLVVVFLSPWLAARSRGLV